MSTSRFLRSIGAAAAAAVIPPSMASGAFASTYICVGEEAGSAVTSGGSTGTCKAKETSVALPSAKTDQETLLSILPHIKYEEKGVAGKPTIRFSGVNVQVVNGENKEASVNGEGNLVLGYDETGISGTGLCSTFVPPPPATQTGSHNLILGSEQSFTSYGGIDAGTCNTISGPWATVLGGDLNTANGGERYGGASVGGGKSNTATGEWSWIGGGESNHTIGGINSISGGSENTTEEYGEPSILGGKRNTASGTGATIDGGELNNATQGAWIGGGQENTASGEQASVAGGRKNSATGTGSSVSGGFSNLASGELAWVGGGYKNAAKGYYCSIYGGLEHESKAEFCAIP